MRMYGNLWSVTRALEGSTILVYTTQIISFFARSDWLLKLKDSFRYSLHEEAVTWPLFSPFNRQNDIIFRGMVIPLSVHIHKKFPAQCW